MNAVATNQPSIELTPSTSRSHVPVSILTFGRSLTFHPSGCLSPRMKQRLTEVAASGGSRIDNPLSFTEMNLFGKDYRVSVHNTFLLSPHQELLESVLSGGDHIQLSDNSYENGGVLSWKSVIDLIGKGSEDVGIKINGKDQYLPDPLSVNHGFVNRDSSVISISLYNLAKALGQEPHTKSYQLYKQRIFDLDNFSAYIDELDNAGNVVSTKRLKLFEEVRFIHNPNAVRNGSVSAKSPNHVLLVIDRTALQLFAKEGYLPGRIQMLLKHYRKPTMKSFLRFLLTNKGTFIENKTLDYFLRKYGETSAFPSSRKVMKQLKDSFINNIEQINDDFGYNLDFHKGRYHLYMQENLNAKK